MSNRTMHRIDHNGWAPRDRDEEVALYGNQGPLCHAGTDTGMYTCTCPIGHLCDHIAAGTKAIYARWARE